MHPVVLEDCQNSQIYDIALGEERGGWTPWVAFRCLRIKIEVSHECLKNLSCYFLQLKIFLNSESNKLQAKETQGASVGQQKPLFSWTSKLFTVIIPVRISTLRNNLDKESCIHEAIFPVKIFIIACKYMECLLMQTFRGPLVYVLYGSMR